MSAKFCGVFPSKVKDIDFKNNLIVGCIPVRALPLPPEDTSPCIIEKCSSCKNKMWVSEKKRNLRKTRSNVEIYCFVCVVVSMQNQGFSKEQIRMINVSEFDN